MRRSRPALVPSVSGLDRFGAGVASPLPFPPSANFHLPTSTSNLDFHSLLPLPLPPLHAPFSPPRALFRPIFIFIFVVVVLSFAPDSFFSSLSSQQSPLLWRPHDHSTPFPLSRLSYRIVSPPSQTDSTRLDPADAFPILHQCSPQSNPHLRLRLHPLRAPSHSFSPIRGRRGCTPCCGPRHR